MDAQELMCRLQVALGLRVKTGQIILNLRDDKLEVVETVTKARLKVTPTPVDVGDGTVHNS